MKKDVRSSAALFRASLAGVKPIHRKIIGAKITSMRNMGEPKIIWNSAGVFATAKPTPPVTTSPVAIVLNTPRM